MIVSQDRDGVAHSQNRIEKRKENTSTQMQIQTPHTNSTAVKRLAKNGQPSG